MSVIRQLIDETGLDTALASVLSTVGSASRGVVSALITENATTQATSILGNVVTITPNADGSWTGRFPSPRLSSAQYWWVSNASTPTPTVAVGWQTGDWVAPKPGSFSWAQAGEFIKRLPMSWDVQSDFSRRLPMTWNVLSGTTPLFSESFPASTEAAFLARAANNAAGGSLTVPVEKFGTRALTIASGATGAYSTTEGAWLSYYHASLPADRSIFTTWATGTDNCVLVGRSSGSWADELCMAVTAGGVKLRTYVGFTATDSSSSIPFIAGNIYRMNLKGVGGGTQVVIKNMTTGAATPAETKTLTITDDVGMRLWWPEYGSGTCSSLKFSALDES